MASSLALRCYLCSSYVPDIGFIRIICFDTLNMASSLALCRYFCCSYAPEFRFIRIIYLLHIYYAFFSSYSALFL
ncbi:unnamed protein product [Meloidogyne enterolobii]|uniref:Uncharacterized protein n=1 Tax=Meloidogyne enterolobii TaxID=390850 RepID=A0ACB1AYS8_MELEN